MAFGWMGIYLLASSGNGTTDSRVEEVITNYLLASTGKGICETVTDTKLDVISRGTAAYEYAKPEPAVLAKFTATCTYYVGGKEIKKRDEYAAYVVIQKSTGNAESVILGIEYMDRVKQRLDSLNFVEG
ncbi:hypothetical protein SRABI118_01137 [Massilia sp. Bi118]|nr:hypothetical protein SRABI118_01137 [Massilia sp. Bi118]